MHVNDTTKDRETTWHILNTRMHRTTPEAEHMHNPWGPIRIHMTHMSHMAHIKYRKYMSPLAGPGSTGIDRSRIRIGRSDRFGAGRLGPIPEFLNLASYHLESKNV
ncbi:hypothetical protein Taro_013744 [Colocasia esculenta]|uniref:Uncharacterized protein n=1 Tax=Colocasia esculenta TaxID=4460 RepID=A0A843UCI2_COLES|nr:hypothetical protein [Colocasia esculenta]